MLFINESVSKDFMLNVVSNEKIELNRKLQLFEFQKKILMSYTKSITTTLEKIEYFENTQKLSELFSNFKKHLDKMRQLEDAFPTFLSKLDSFKSESTKKDLIKLSEEYNSELNVLQKDLDTFSKDLEKFIQDIQEFVEFKFLDSYTYEEKNTIKDTKSKTQESSLKSNTESANYSYSENTSTSIPEAHKEQENANASTSSEGISDNNCLLISELENKVFLPYKIKTLNEKLSNSKKYSDIFEIIQKEYIFPLDKYKNPILSRFKEAYGLMKNKENASFLESLDLAIELSFNSTLNPAVIAACENKTELDIYLDCLYENELEQFKIFDIKYEINPTIKL